MKSTTKKKKKNIGKWLLSTGLIITTVLTSFSQVNITKVQAATIPAEASVFTFTNAGATGMYGPTQAQVNSAYSSTNLAGNVTVVNGSQNWNIPRTGNYKIEVRGAQGGNSYAYSGGAGAVLTSTHNLAAGTQLTLLVGQAGTAASSNVYYNGSSYYNDYWHSGAGGGGGSYVYNGNTPLVIAGGGSGANTVGYGSSASTSTIPSTSTNLGNYASGANGNNGPANGGSAYNNFGASGVAGSGGAGGGSGAATAFYNRNSGGGGANFSVSTRTSYGGSGGYAAYIDMYTPAIQGGAGGFGGGGGGGAAHPVGCNDYYVRSSGSGGGGGYSGGGGGGSGQSWCNISTDKSSYGGTGNGGGSYSATTLTSSSADNTGHGRITITYLGPVTTLSVPADNASIQDSYINLNWNTNSNDGIAIKNYEIEIEEKRPTDVNWKPATKYTTTTKPYTFNIPAGTPGNTQYRWRVRATNTSDHIGPYSATREFTFSNNVPTLTTTFNSAEKDLSNSLDKRTMSFSVDTLVDPDDFNYVKLYAEMQGVPGSKAQLGTDITGPVSWTKKNYKLKVIPTFKSTGSTYDLVVVDASNENTVFATLLDDRAMQAGGAAAPESFTFLIYAEDYQNTLNTKLSTSAAKTIGITIDTRNYLPRTFNVTHDINNRIMSANQGFNRVKVNGSVDDLDPTDDINVYYTVKLASDKVAGKYVLNPTTDTFVQKITSTGNGATGTFSATYTVQESLANGDYVLLVYGADSRNGIGDPVVMNFTVNKTNPDIRFYANYNGNVLATAERQVLAKNSKLKMYFSAYDYTTFEYAGYIVRANQQNTSGTYEDLSIRGAFTNDVPSQFIGVDLSDSLFNKGDMLVFKFRAISSTGVVIKKDIRVLIGDQINTVADLTDSKIPTSLLTK